METEIELIIEQVFTKGDLVKLNGKVYKIEKRTRLSICRDRYALKLKAM